MKRLARSAMSVLAALAIPVPAFAQPHVIAQLGTAPLVGQISSTPELQADVARQSDLFRTAGSKLGLTPQEYSQVAARIAARQVTYVTLPRHLDAMSWYGGGQVYVIKDVIIPAGTNGWEIDVPEASQEVAVFIPAKCGNLSLVRRTRPHIARVAPAKVAPKPKVAAAIATPPPAPQTPAVYVAPAATPPPAPVQSVAAAAPVVHHLRLWPLLLLPIIGFAVSHPGGSPPGYLTPPPVVTLPNPPPPAGAGCPPPH